MMARLGGGLMACAGELAPTAAPGQATLRTKHVGEWNVAPRYSGWTIEEEVDSPLSLSLLGPFDLLLRLLCLLPNLEPMLFIFRANSSNLSLKRSSIPHPQVHRGNCRRSPNSSVAS